MASPLFNNTRPSTHPVELTCERTRPTFYRVENPMEPRARNERKVWLTKSRGRGTCPQDGSPVVTVTRDGRRTNLCLACLNA
jgi:hypothetical protein